MTPTPNFDLTTTWNQSTDALLTFPSKERRVVQQDQTFVVSVPRSDPGSNGSHLEIDEKKTTDWTPVLISHDFPCWKLTKWEWWELNFTEWRTSTSWLKETPMRTTIYQQLRVFDRSLFIPSLRQGQGRFWTTGICPQEKKWKNRTKFGWEKLRSKFWSRTPVN